MRIGGEDRLIAAEDVGRYRDALGTMPPGGMPAAFLEPVPDALRSLVARFARWRGPFPTRLLAERYGLEPAVAERELAALEREGTLVRGALRPGGSGQRMVRRRGAAPHPPRVRRRLRREVEAVEQPALARFALAWHGIGRKGRGGVDRLREVLFPLQRLPLAPEVWERQVLPLRMDYRPELLDQLCTSGELVWLGADAGRVALAFREDAALLGPPPGQAPPPADPAAEAVRAALQGARHLGELVAETGLPEAEMIEALWRLVAVGRGHERRLGAAPAHAARGDAAHARRRAGHAPADAAAACAPRGAALGRWAPTAPLLARADRRGRPPARARRAAARAPRRARARRRRRRGRARRARRACAARSASSRRSASRGAATSSTASAARSTRCRARSSACARCAIRRPTRRRSRSPRAIRRTRTASRCAGRRAPPAAPRARPAPSSCCATASRSRSSSAARRTLLSLQPLELADWAAVAEALATRVARGPRGLAAARAHRRRGRATGTPVGAAFTAAGFVAGPAAPDAAREALTLPEGHTLELAARRMAPLAGQRVAAAGPGYQSPLRARRRRSTASVLESVEARGKHLLAAFDNGRILHSHLRMTGAWHVYPRRASAGRARRGARG